MKLKEMKVGDVARVKEFTDSDPNYRQKLLRMGLNRNTVFSVIRKAPFGGPIEIEVRGFRLVLRSNEADVLEVEPQ
jgi:ferrous iron transport protein A